MKATVSLKDLKKAIDHVSVCVPSRSSIPVLTGLLIEAENKETIKILSNDMEMGIIAKCQAQVEESTSVVPVSYTHLRAHETPEHLVCRLLLEKKKETHKQNNHKLRHT